jgi:hypothetical protein
MIQVSINYIITFFKRLNEMDQISAEMGCFLTPRGTPPPPSKPVSETVSKQYPDRLSRWGYKRLYINWFLKKQ